MSDGFKIPALDAGRIADLGAKTMRPAAAPGGAAPGRSFGEFMAEAVTEVQRLQTEADHTIKQLVAGEIKDVSEAMVAVEKADVAFQTMMTVRQKVMTAYEEIMRMQV